MNILCKLFGHQPPVYARKGWYSPGEEYAKLSCGWHDGIGRNHGTIESECPRCGTFFHLCRVHVPDEGKS